MKKDVFNECTSCGLEAAQFGKGFNGDEIFLCEDCAQAFSAGQKYYTEDPVVLDDTGPAILNEPEHETRETCSYCHLPDREASFSHRTDNGIGEAYMCYCCRDAFLDGQASTNRGEGVQLSPLQVSVKRVVRFTCPICLLQVEASSEHEETGQAECPHCGTWFEMLE